MSMHFFCFFKTKHIPLLLEKLHLAYIYQLIYNKIRNKPHHYFHTERPYQQPNTMKTILLFFAAACLCLGTQAQVHEVFHQQVSKTITRMLPNGTKMTYVRPGQVGFLIFSNATSQRYIEMPSFLDINDMEVADGTVYFCGDIIPSATGTCYDFVKLPVYTINSAIFGESTNPNTAHKTYHSLGYGPNMSYTFQQTICY